MLGAPLSLGGTISEDMTAGEGLAEGGHTASEQQPTT